MKPELKYKQLDSSSELQKSTAGGEEIHAFTAGTSHLFCQSYKKRVGSMEAPTNCSVRFRARAL